MILLYDNVTVFIVSGLHHNYASLANEANVMIRGQVLQVSHGSDNPR